MSSGNLLALGFGLTGFMMASVSAYFAFQAQADTGWLHEQYAEDSETLEALAEELAAVKQGQQAANLQVVAAREESQAVSKQLSLLQQMVFDIEWQMEQSGAPKPPGSGGGNDSAGAPSTDLAEAASLSESRRLLLEGKATDADIEMVVGLAEKLGRLPGLRADLETAAEAFPDNAAIKAALASVAAKLAAAKEDADGE